jgi:hypothetical protein
MPTVADMLAKGELDIAKAVRNYPAEGGGVTPPSAISWRAIGERRRHMPAGASPTDLDRVVLEKRPPREP